MIIRKAPFIVFEVAVFMGIQIGARGIDAVPEIAYATTNAGIRRISGYANGEIGLAT